MNNRCSNCGRLISSDFKICPYCIKKIERIDIDKKQQKECNICNRTIPFDAKLCPYCGVKMNDTSKFYTGPEKDIREIKTEEKKELFEKPIASVKEKSGIEKEPVTKSVDGVIRSAKDDKDSVETSTVPNPKIMKSGIMAKPIIILLVFIAIIAVSMVAADYMNIISIDVFENQPPSLSVSANHSIEYQPSEGSFNVQADEESIMDIHVSDGTMIENSLGHSWEPLGPNLQLAIDDLGEQGGVVYLPKDIVLIVPDTVWVPSNFTMLGWGHSSCIKLADNASYEGHEAPVIKNKNADGDVYPGGGIGDSNILLKDFRIDGNGLNQMYQPVTHVIRRRNNGVFFTKVNNITIDGLLIEHTGCCGIHTWNPCPDCMFPPYGDYGYNIKVINTEVAYCGEILEGTGTIDCGPCGIWLECRDGSIIKNCVAHDCYSDGIALETHWSSTGVNPADFTCNWIIEDCEAYNCLGGFWVEKVRDGMIRNCTSHDNTKDEAYENFRGTGFVIGGGSFNILVQDCEAWGNAWRGFSNNGPICITFDRCIAHDNGFLIDPPGGMGGGIVLGGTCGWEEVPCPPPEEQGFHVVTNCQSYDNIGYGIRMGKLNPTIKWNYINNVTYTGISLYSPYDDINPSGEVAYNSINNVGKSYIWESGYTNLNIHDNKCDGEKCPLE